MTFENSLKARKNFSIFNTRGIVSLDLLRGLAAYLVIVPHYFLFLGYKSEFLEFCSIFAVEIFFVLSGYVLGPQLYKIFKYPTYSNLKTFYLRRWMRTIPIYLIVMLSVALLTPNISFDKIISYVFFYTTWIEIPENDEFYLPAWSLAIEEWFYIIFPLILTTFSLFKKKQVYAILFFLLLFFIIKFFPYTQSLTDNHGLRRITFFRLDAIAYGYLTYYFFKNKSILSKNNKKLLWFLVPLFVLISYISFLKKIDLIYIYFSAAAAILILISFRYSNIYLFKNNMVIKLSAFFANTSYCAYLIHLLIFLLAEKFFFLTTISLIIYILIILFIATVSYYFLEKPILNLRPSYNSLVMRDNSFKNSILFNIFSNLSFCLIFLWLAEFSASKIIKLYNNLYVNKIYQSHNIKLSDEKAKSNLDIRAKVERDYKKRQNIDGSAYYYESYIVYKNKKFKSETINIEENHLRKTSTNELNKYKKDYIIWVFGASPVFGRTNSDSFTLPSQLQVYLQKYLNYNVIVRNYGVEGYTSWQQIPSLQMAILEKEKPDMVLVFNLQYDYENLYHDPKENCSHLLRTALGSKEVLKNSWYYLSSKNYIFYNDFFQNIKTFFPAINDISKLLFKAPKVLLNKMNPEASKLEYEKKREVYQIRIQKCLEKMKTSYLNNILLMAKLTQSVNATFVAGILPEIRSSKKVHVKNELKEMYFIKNNYTALNDIELKDIEILPNSRLFQNRFENTLSFNQNLKMIKDELNQIAKENNFFILDLMPLANVTTNNIQIFSTNSHFTNTGNEYLVKNSIGKILKIIDADNK